MDCWRNFSSISPGTLPCASADSNTIVPCCFKGDICLSNNICKYTHYPWAGYETGYYVAGCTDPSEQDASCTQACDANVPDVMYNTTESLWHCCGRHDDGTPACERPTNLTFQAPAPNDLFAYSLSPSSTSSASSKASVASTPSSTSSSSTTLSGGSLTPTPSSATSSGSSGLSGGAKGGISVGVVIGVVLIFLLSALLYSSRKRQKQSEAAIIASPRGQHVSWENPAHTEQQQRQIELHGRARDHELDPNREFYELFGRGHTN